MGERVAISVVADDLRAVVSRAVAAAGWDAVIAPRVDERRGAAVAAIVDLAGAQTCARDSGPFLLVSTTEPNIEILAAAVRIGARAVFTMPHQEGDLVAALASLQVPLQRGALLGVMGGHGGAGASVLAATLALAATRRDASALLIDADPLSGGADVLLGVEPHAGFRWSEIHAEGRLDPQSLAAVLPRIRGLWVLTGGAPSAAAISAAATAGREFAALTVVDLPRSSAGFAAASTMDQIVVITRGTIRGAWATKATVAHLAAGGDTGRLRLVVRGPAPELGARHIASAVGVPLAAAMRAQPGLDAAVERGLRLRRRGPLRACADELLKAAA